QDSGEVTGVRTEVSIGGGVHAGKQLGARSGGSVGGVRLGDEVEADPAGVDVEFHGAHDAGTHEHVGEADGGETVVAAQTRLPSGRTPIPERQTKTRVPSVSSHRLLVLPSMPG